MLFLIQRRHSRLKMGVGGLSLKTVGRELKVPQMEARSTGLWVSSPDFVFNIHKSFYL